MKEYYIASVSWGKDSLYMLLRLLEEGAPLNEVAFYDTGYVGIAADEPKRIKKLAAQKIAPLAEWGATEAD